MEGTYMNERRRDDDTSAKLLQRDEQHAHLVGQVPHEEDGCEDTERAGSQHGEDEPDPKRHVIVAVNLGAVLLAAALRLAGGDAVSFGNVSKARLDGKKAATHSTPAWK